MRVLTAEDAENLFGIFMFALILISLLGILDILLTSSVFVNKQEFSTYFMIKNIIASFTKNFLIVFSVAVPVAISYFVLKGEIARRGRKGR